MEIEIEATMPPPPVDVDGTLVTIDSIVWTEEVIEVDGLLEEAQ